MKTTNRTELIESLVEMVQNAINRAQIPTHEGRVGEVSHMIIYNRDKELGELGNLGAAESGGELSFDQPIGTLTCVEFLCLACESIIGGSLNSTCGRESDANWLCS